MAGETNQSPNNIPVTVLVEDIRGIVQCQMSPGVLSQLAPPRLVLPSNIETAARSALVKNRFGSISTVPRCLASFDI